MRAGQSERRSHLRAQRFSRKGSASQKLSYQGLTAPQKTRIVRATRRRGPSATQGEAKGSAHFFFTPLGAIDLSDRRRHRTQMTRCGYANRAVFSRTPSSCIFEEKNENLSPREEPQSKRRRQDVRRDDCGSSTAVDSTQRTLGPKQHPQSQKKQKSLVKVSQTVSQRFHRGEMTVCLAGIQAHFFFFSRHAKENANVFVLLKGFITPFRGSKRNDHEGGSANLKLKYIAPALKLPIASLNAKLS